MSITIISIPGPTSNSYVSLAEADAYMETHIKAAEWAAFGNEVRKAAIVASTREMDMYQFRGRRTDQAQSLNWPRTGLTDFDGFPIVGVPTKLKAAITELAIWNLNEDDRLADNFTLEQMSSVEIGPLKYKLKDQSGTSLPSIVKRLIGSIGPNIADGIETGANSAKIMVL